MNLRDVPWPEMSFEMAEFCHVLSCFVLHRFKSLRNANDWATWKLIADRLHDLEARRTVRPQKNCQRAVRNPRSTSIRLIRLIRLYDPIQEIHQRLADAMGAEELQALRAALVGELLEAAVAPPVTNLVRSDGPKLQYVGYMLDIHWAICSDFEGLAHWGLHPHGSKGSEVLLVNVRLNHHFLCIWILESEKEFHRRFPTKAPTLGARLVPWSRGAVVPWSCSGGGTFDGLHQRRGRETWTCLCRCLCRCPLPARPCAQASWSLGVSRKRRRRRRTRRILGQLGPTWGHCTEGSVESAWHLLARLGHISRQVSSPEECVAPAISCQKDLEVWQNLWPAWPCWHGYHGRHGRMYPLYSIAKIRLLGKWMQKATWFHQFSSISSFFLLFTMENMNVGLQRCYFVGPQNLCRKHRRSRNEETYQQNPCNCIQKNTICSFCRIQSRFWVHLILVYSCIFLSCCATGHSCASQWDRAALLESKLSLLILSTLKTWERHEKDMRKEKDLFFLNLKDLLVPSWNRFYNLLVSVSSLRRSDACLLAWAYGPPPCQKPRREAPPRFCTQQIVQFLQIEQKEPFHN